MIRIATAQNFVTGDPIQNGEEIRFLMGEAALAGADLIHFPEGAISGYAKSPIKSWSDVDWEILESELNLIADYAKEKKIWVIAGANHRLTIPNRPHNSLYIISNEGQLHSRYDKQWCSHSEINDWYTPGRSNVVFEINGWRFGCSLCIEIQFPELFMSYEKQGIDCMLFSSFSDSEMFRVQAQGHAASNNYWFSFAVPTQCSKLAPASLIGPDGNIVNSCSSNKSGITISNLDRNDPKWEVPIKYARPWRTIARKREIYDSSIVDDERSDKKAEF
jgi:predicted amidohydrolase